MRVDELGDVAAENRDLPHQRRRDEHVLLGGRHEERFQVRVETAVHAGELELVFEIRYRAQPAQYHTGALMAHEIDQPAAEADHMHVFYIAEHCARDLDPLVEREIGFLGVARSDPEDERIEEPAGAAHDLLVAAGERIKRSRVDRLDHGLSTRKAGSSPVPPAPASTP